MIVAPLAVAVALLATPDTARLRVDTVRSRALGIAKQYVIHLPRSYYRDTTRRFPVVYYLHGLGGDEWNWVRMGRLPQVADSLAAAGRGEVIVVMPDGDDGWWTTWNTLGDQRRCLADRARTERAASYCVPWPHYDDYVARDLVSHVDARWRTMPERAHRGIAGLSMGGLGAVSLALAYPDVFAVAASHSGVLSPSLIGRDMTGARRFARTADEMRVRWPSLWPTVAPALGRDPAAWRARDPAALLRRARRRAASGSATLPAIHVDVGTGDAFLEQNRAFREAMESEALAPGAFVYREWPGAHDWSYWRAHVGESLAWIASRLGASRAM